MRRFEQELKAFIGVTVQAINGSKDALSYLNKVAHVWGLTVSPGLSLNTPPGFRSARTLENNAGKTRKAANAYASVLCGNRLKTPTWKDLITFRMTRSFIPYMPFMAKDCEYYSEKGWMQSDYYYPARLSFVRKLIGRFFDAQGKKLGEKVKAKREKERR